MEFLFPEKCAKILFVHKSLSVKQLEMLSHVHQKCITQVRRRQILWFHHRLRNKVVQLMLKSLDNISGNYSTIVLMLNVLTNKYP